MRYLKYFIVQLKRTLKLAVGVFPTAMLLFACLGMAAYLFMSTGPLAEKQQKYKIGIVGKVDESYLGFGVYAIQTLDASRFMVDFIPMEEEEARNAFRSGELVAYVRIPEEFLDSIIYGRNDVPIGYVAAEGQKGIEGYLMDELSVVVSNLVTSSQCSIYSMQEAAYRTGNKSHIGEWTDEINLQLIGYVLGRTGLAELETLGYSDGLLVRQYYFCAILLLFCFLFGISSAPLFLRRNEDLGKWMRMRGIGPTAQVLCEFFVYFLFMMACVGIPVSILNVVTKQFAFLNAKVWLNEMLWALVPVILMTCAMHFVIYEVVKNPVANLLLQFIGVLGMGYVSGYVYPASFFPEGIAAVGRSLPTGVTLKYFSGKLIGVGVGGSFWACMTYFLLFIGISIFARRWMIMRENK